MQLGDLSDTSHAKMLNLEGTTEAVEQAFREASVHLHACVEECVDVPVEDRHKKADLINKLLHLEGIYLVSIYVAEDVFEMPEAMQESLEVSTGKAVSVTISGLPGPHLQIAAKEALGMALRGLRRMPHPERMHNAGLRPRQKHRRSRDRQGRSRSRHRHSQHEHHSRRAEGRDKAHRSRTRRGRSRHGRNSSCSRSRSRRSHRRSKPN